MQDLDDFVEEHDEDVILNPAINWSNVWFNILVSPKETLQFVFQKDRVRHVWLIYLLMALLSGISQLTTIQFSIESQPTGYWFGLILGSGLVVIVLYGFMSLVLKYIGLWVFGFKGGFMDFMIIQAWSLIPVFIAISLQVLINLLLKLEHPDGINGGGDLAVLATVLVGLIRGIGLIWAIVIAITGVKLIQDTTTAKSIGNYVSAGLVLILALFGVSMLYVFYKSQQSFSIYDSSPEYEDVISQKK